MRDILHARNIFETGEYSCVLFKSGTAYTSTLKGITPLVNWLNEGVDIQGFSAADKIVGKAAAMLFILGKIREIYAPVMSESALHLFNKNGIYASCNSLVPMIINRAGTGQCPMESAVAEVDDPAEALQVLNRTLTKLRGGGGHK